MTFKRTMLAAIALAAGCHGAWAQQENTDAAASSVPAGQTTPRKPPASDALGDPQPPAPVGEPRIIRGSDQVIAAPKGGVPAIAGAPSTFNFEEAPIAEVARTILGDIAKADYVLHQPIAGSITLSTRAPVSPDQAAFLLESALQANGLAMARDVRGTYHVGKPEVLKGIVPGVRQAVANTPLPPGTGPIIIPLQYIGAAEMAIILRPLAAADAILRVDTVRNLLIMVGNRTQAEGWLDIVSTFDVNLLKGMSVGVFPLKYITAKEVEAALQLMGSGGTAPAKTSGSAPAAGAAAASGGGAAAAGAGAGAGLSETNPLYGALRILPIERINSVLVVTPYAAYLDEARKWIERLDRPSDNGSEPQLYVYPVQNGNASHLASVLNGIFGSATAAQGASANTGVAPGLTQSMGSTSGFGNSLGASTGASSSALSMALGMGGSPSSGTSAGSAMQNGQNAPRVTVATYGQNLRVVADEANNAIVIYGTKAEYAKIEAAMRRLDVPPTQVLIEASIIEVTLNDELRYGLQWFFNNGARSGYSGSGTVGQPAANAMAGASAGFAYTLFNSLGNVRATLNALADKSLVKVISSPSLMVLDNQLATIMVGNQQPIKTGETSYVGSTNGNITTTYQYKDTGVMLGVLPSVNAGDMVTMQISQTVTDVGDADSTTGQRAFLQRQIASKVAVRSGETLVLGGLIKDNTTNGRAGVPFLQDIPIIGNAFGSTTVQNGRTELLVIITPRVVRTDQDARAVGGELREGMRALSEWRGLQRGAIAAPAQSVPAP
ncbi:type II secretion system secretin GspD [Ramlibacter sp. H39-3-26]|uniref:type II secretion system secretin GspD n=1 Tax=Curvibacter soli TaxID=3031331 RepID=UPI0023DCE594|nr:type II secretion system secretin GspD [Ramlibacter sp. H39-3-26]MDF1486402.1 type II secretion system secretin GspD [Ramlibacter sp. H39-3-26]